uniref:Sorting nexin family member 21 n=1 Tax=Kryptolebias marmoratus TaxID=37003 RepID=A0A3Q3A2D4_KRYMA
FLLGGGGGVMASRFLDRLKRSLFKDGPPVEPEQEAGGEQEEEGFSKDLWEAELEEEEECVSERLGGTLCFDVGADDGAKGDGEGRDSDSDFLGESMEEGLSTPCRTAPPNMWWVFPESSMFLSERQPSCVLKRPSLQLYTIHVIQSGGSDKTPAVITRRYSDFQRLHATLRRNHGDQMERVSFPRKKLRRNFTAETIAKRSRAFEQYLSHLCSLAVLRAAPSVREFFYLSDLQAGQLLIRAGRFQEALGPLLNAKRLQQKLGWACNHDNQTQASPLAYSHWFFTLVGLLYCFQEVEQLEEAWDHCDHALPPPPPPPRLDRPHPLLPLLLPAMIRLSWQTGRDKQQWEELLQRLQDQEAEPDNHPTIREFLVKQNLQDGDGEN